jgi:glycosyltransferase involved in cell wall biosynthesis
MNNISQIHLSVVIPCLNAEKVLGEQLQALSQQECNFSWEVIVADNGSTDGTFKTIEQYREKLDTLKVIDASGKKSASYARNCGAQAAKGDSIAFCDADDIVDKHWVQEIGDALQKYDVVASRIEVNEINDERTARLMPDIQRDGLMKYTYVPYLEHASSSGLGVQKKVHAEIGGFDESIMNAGVEDCDYCWRVQLAGYRIQFIPGAILHYRLKDTPMGKYKQAKTWGEGNTYLVKKFTPLGMPKPTLKVGIDLWKRLFRIRRLMGLKNPAIRDRWIWDLGYRVGQLKGSIKYKTLAL